MPEIQYPPGIAYIDGQYVPMSEAKISVLDWGFLHSDATYDVVHVWKRRFFRLDKHIDRFQQSIDKLRLKLPFEREVLEEILKQCVIRSGLDDVYVEMVLTRGVSPTFSRDPRDAINTFFAFAIPFGWVANEEQRERGLNLAVGRHVRIPGKSVDPTIKNYHWLDFIQSLYDAYDRDAENVLLCNESGHITEGPGFNIFVIRDGILKTPQSGVLEGITRTTAIELCFELRYAVETADISLEELMQADEVFITSTAGGIMPVGRIEGTVVGMECPGPRTSALMDLYWHKHKNPAWTTPVD